MTRILINFLFFTFALGYVGLTNSYSQDSKISSGRKKVSICEISFLVPKGLENQKARGIDSCVARFKSSKIELELDKGWYGSASKKYKGRVDFKEEFIQIDGKKSQLATYTDDGNTTNKKFVARIYVVLFEPQSEQIGATTSLNMTIRAESEKDLETAKQIFQSIRFDK